MNLFLCRTIIRYQSINLFVTSSFSEFNVWKKGWVIFLYKLNYTIILYLQRTLLLLLEA